MIKKGPESSSDDLSSPSRKRHRRNAICWHQGSEEVAALREVVVNIQLGGIQVETNENELNNMDPTSDVKNKNARQSTDTNEMSQLDENDSDEENDEDIVSTQESTISESDIKENENVVVDDILVHNTIMEESSKLKPESEVNDSVESITTTTTTTIIITIPSNETSSD